MKEKIIKTTIIAIVMVLSGLLFCCGREASLEVQEEEAGSQLEELAGPSEEQEEAQKEGQKEEKEPETSVVCVYVCGAVENPGVYSLTEGSRKVDAVQMAGGMTAEAAPQAINLAEILSDGERVQVPTMEEVAAGEFTAGDSPESDLTGISGKGSAGLVNINQADLSALMTLPGIGQGRASSILVYRQEHGRFTSLEELMQVEGIKQGIFDKIRDMICI